MLIFEDFTRSSFNTRQSFLLTSFYSGGPFKSILTQDLLKLIKGD